MSKERDFLIFAVEYYRSKKNMTGRSVADIFSKHGIYRMILDNYFLYHIESPDHFVGEIDDVIGKRSQSAAGLINAVDKI